MTEPLSSPIRIQHPAAHHAISLAPLTTEEIATQALIKDEHILPSAPANFREFGSLRAGQIAEPKRFALRFASAAMLTKIESTPDFIIEQGGSCLEGNLYSANASCTLMVRFAPQGPGRRTGKLAITSSADATPFVVGIGGNGSAPVISFTPSLISTVPGTLVSGSGLLSGASNLAIDGGDGLYMVDTGNNLLRYLGSNGKVQTLDVQEPYTAPIGIALDNFGTRYISQDNPAVVYVTTPAEQGTFYEAGNNSPCAVGSTCDLSSAPFSDPGALASDSSGNVFMTSGIYVYQLLASTLPYSGTYVLLENFYSVPQATYPNGSPIAVDASDNIYSFYSGVSQEPGGYVCFVSSNNLYYAENINLGHINFIVGGQGCGFSGDGGQARSALIGTNIGQMALDLAGNLYFTDTSNNRVRRVDASTGIIHTIAGTGVAGYNGDTGPATNAALNTPTGVAVDSQGQVYVISTSATTGQVIRKVGITGEMTMAGTSVGTPRGAQTVTLSNTGNASLNFTHAAFVSGNTADFTVDPNTTSCNFTVPLPSGHSCLIGFLFDPTAAGTRAATFTITDDTVTGSNTINLNGVGFTTATLTPAAFSFANTAVGSASASQTATLTNTGKAVMTISSIAFSGAGETSYTDTTTCGTTLAVGASCAIAVTFKPAAAAAEPATLTVTDNALTQHQTVTLTGTGLPDAKAALSPTSAAFGNQTISTASAVKTLILTNSGGASLTITSYTFSGTNSGDFTQTHTCGSTLAAAAMCTISVTFKPAATGARSGTLTIATSGGSVAATLTGTGTAAAAKAELSPASANFGNQTVTTAGEPRPLTLTNTGTVPLSIGAWTMTGSNAAEYTQTHTCGTTLAPSTSCSVAVVFSPTAAGIRTGTLTVTTSAGAMVTTMTGTAVTPTTATFTPTVLTFANTTLGSSSAPQTATITNTGGAALVIASISLSGALNKSYSDTTTCAATLAPGAHCTITVTFTPTVTGTNRVTLSMADNTTVVHQNVALTGIGVAAATPSTQKELGPHEPTHPRPSSSLSIDRSWNVVLPADRRLALLGYEVNMPALAKHEAHKCRMDIAALDSNPGQR